jgi:Skp family chaperone for outer membrane proteins
MTAVEFHFRSFPTVKKLLIPLTLAAGLCGSLVWLPDACGQNGATPSRAVKPAPTSRIAFVDMGDVLRKYKKAEDLTEVVKSAAEAAQAKDRENVVRTQELGRELQVAEIDQDSPEFREKEKKIVQLSTNVKAFRAVTQKDLKKRQARALLDIYQDVTAAVQQIAEQNGYTLVLRIDREAEAARSYTLIQQSMNQPVVRHSSPDDISNAVIAWLNKQYDAAGGAASLSAAADSASAGGKSPATRTAPRDIPAPGSRKATSR